jgi:hypothetical protein
MDKLDRISQLQDDNAASLAEIARRQEERANNPDFEEETPTTIVKYDDEELIYKDHMPAAVDWGNWEKWLQGHLAVARKALLDDLTAATGELIVALRREWRADIDQLRRQWETDKRERSIRDQTIVERSGRIAELQKQNAEAHALLTRQQQDQMLAERDARIAKLEARLAALFTFIGGSLPRGFPGDE